MSDPAPTPSRNEPCPCGSGKRYKHCHGSSGSTGVEHDRRVIAGAARWPEPQLVGMGEVDATATLHDALQTHQAGDLHRAETLYLRVLEARPDDPHARHFLGVIRMQSGDPRGALASLRRAVEQLPGEPEFHNNLGLALAASDDLHSAIRAYRRALELEQKRPVYWNNLGLALQALNAIEESIAAFERALALDGTFAEAHWNLSLSRLVMGDYERGFEGYEWRLALPALHGGATIPAPRWDGTPVRSLVLHAEQGIGDALQFVRYASLFARTCDHVVVQCSDELAPLVATVPGVSRTLRPDAACDGFDAHLPLLSSARIAKTRIDSIPATVPYLSTEMTSEQEAARGEREKLAVGLAWAGNRSHANDRNRSMAFSTLEPLVDMSSFAWFSLQHGDAQRELDVSPRKQFVTRLPVTATLLDTARLISSLDLVITVDTAVAHLAGALGRPVWILLPFAPDWRWLLERDDSPWYASARLFRQAAPGAWDDVVARVQSALATFAGTARVAPNMQDTAPPQGH